MGSAHTVDYYTAMKRSEALTQAIAWTNLKNMMLGEIIQTQKVMYCMTPFIRNVFFSV